MIQLKRAYDPRGPSDGYRVLVDRLWPRGLSKEEAHFDAWLKDLAPSEGLRKWFGHEPERFREFRRRYEEELAAEPARGLFEELLERAGHRTVTLLYAARDQEHNNAVVLAALLDRRLARLHRNRRGGKRSEAA